MPTPQEVPMTKKCFSNLFFNFVCIFALVCSTNSMAQNRNEKPIKGGETIGGGAYRLTVPVAGGALQKNTWLYAQISGEEIIMDSPNVPEFRLRNRLADGSVSWLATITIRKPRGATSAANYMESVAKGVKVTPYPTENKNNACVETELLDEAKTGQKGFYLMSLICFDSKNNKLYDLSFSELNTLDRAPDKHFLKAASDLFAGFKLH
jgi:hypothetical protein